MVMYAYAHEAIDQMPREDCSLSGYTLMNVPIFILMVSSQRPIGGVVFVFVVYTWCRGSREDHGHDTTAEIHVYLADCTGNRLSDR
jgi:hypothetical protein